MATALGPADAVREGEPRGFEVGPAPSRLVVVRRHGRIHAYVNLCPHAGTLLNFLPDRFLDAEGRLLCATHGARFRVEDGLCVAGPCRGRSLERIAVSERDGVLWAELADR